MKNNLYEQGPAFFFWVVGEYLGSQWRRIHMAWKKQAKNNLGLADILSKQSILLESSFVRQTLVMTKNNNSHGKRNSIWIQWALFNRQESVRSGLCQLFRILHAYCLLYMIIYHYMMSTSDDAYGNQKSIWVYWEMNQTK